MKHLPLYLMLIASAAVAREIPVITAGTGGHPVILTIVNDAEETKILDLRISPARLPAGVQLLPATAYIDSIPPGTEREVAFTLDAGPGVRLSGPDTLLLDIRSPFIAPVSRVMVFRFVAPDAFALGEVYPNPFNSSAKCEMRISKWGMTRVALFDLLGREVRVVREEFMGPGVYPIGIDARSLASGVYFLRMTAAPADGSGGYSAVRRLTLIR